MVALGEERTIEQDTAFALRILVDIAIRALSPAVNDPTTAVQVLGALEDLLLRIGESDLTGRGTLRDAGGDVRVLVATRRWEDLLALALTEIRDYGSRPGGCRAPAVAYASAHYRQKEGNARRIVAALRSSLRARRRFTRSRRRPPAPPC